VAGFADIVRDGIALADELTATLQATVQHEAWTGQSGYGDATYAAAVDHLALVSKRVRERRRADGSIVVTMAKVTFLRPVEANGTAGRQEPVDPRDRITLPDGSTGPIVDAAGLVDPDTGAPYQTSVWLGTS